MDHAASTIVLFLISIAVTLALSAGGALHACGRLLEAHGLPSLTAPRALLAGLTGGALGAFVSTAALLLIPPIRHSWESIGAQVGLQIAAGLLLGCAIGALFYRVVRGGSLNRAS